MNGGGGASASLMTTTGTLPEHLSEGEARRLTQQIQLLTGSIADQIDLVITLIAEAETGRAWEALGYPSWTAYCSQEFAGSLPRLDRQVRQQLVGSLTEAGMSSRAIAPIVGVSHMQVTRDQTASAVTNVTPDAADECDPDAVIVDAEIIEEPPKPITGRDGKSYRKSETTAKSAARRSLVDYARDTADQLRKVTIRLESIAADDRLSRNKEQVAARLRFELDRVSTVGQELLAQLELVARRPLLDPAELVPDPAELADMHAMTDGVSDEMFEAALAEAKAEGDLSRANVIRKITELKQEPAP